MSSVPAIGLSSLVLQRIAQLPGRLTARDPIYVQEYGLLLVLCSNEHEISGVAGASYTYVRPTILLRYEAKQ